jgi:hypothetical protein
MAAVELQILEPLNDSPFNGDAVVAFRGAVRSMPSALQGIQLYYRWYSSLHEAEIDRYSLHAVPLLRPDQPFAERLGIGTHAITFAASDQPGETAEALEAVHHGGVTGGSSGEERCLVHVFKANVILPEDHALLTSRTVELKAEAPALWAKESVDPENCRFVANRDYLAINRLGYRWRFQPLGPPADRETVEVAPPVGALGFDTELGAVCHWATLPPSAEGSYALTLFVEDNQSAGIGPDSQTIEITIGEP